jgi:hypothetical protein
VGETGGGGGRRRRRRRRRYSLFFCFTGTNADVVSVLLVQQYKC